VKRVGVWACLAFVVSGVVGCNDPALNTLASNVLRPILGQPQQLTPAPARPAAATPPAAGPTPPPAAPVEQVTVTPAPTEPPPEPDANRLALRLPPAPRGLRLTPPGGVEPVRVAIVLPLSGPNAALGQSLLNAATLALFDMGDTRLQLMPRDDVGLPEGAVDAVESALQDGAQLILGPVFSASVQAVAPRARSRDVNVVAFSTDREVAGNGVFLIGFTPEQQIERLVAFARSQGLGRFAALLPSTAYGNTVEAALRTAASRTGGALVRIERYEPGLPEFSEPVQRLADYRRRRAELDALRRDVDTQDSDVARRALSRLEERGALGDSGFDSVLVAEGGERLRAIASLLPFYDVNPTRVRFLGTGLWDDPNLGREPALVGGWYVAPPSAEREQFRGRYERAFGEAPQRLASLAYDATALAAVLARAPGGADFSTRALAAPAGFAGIDGIFRFRPDGVAERGLAVLEVRPRGVRIMSPAPDSFASITN
jgi:ABC-type branched-subunit amino acid transport system substrate-binding protein